MQSRSHTRRMAEFAASLKMSDIPANVMARAKGLALDGFGCALYATNVEWTRLMAGVVRRMEPQGGIATVWGRRESASPVNAALVNGTMVQGFELDDFHPRASLHACAVVLPAVLAAAEYLGTDRVSGERLLRAMVAGFEIGPRVGLCMGRENMTLNGWHSGSLSAPFAGAVAAAVVMQLNASQCAHALGIAGSQVGGLMAASHGGMVKRMHVGRAAQSGLYSALLAADGYTGTENVFEEEHGGFCSTYSHRNDQYDLNELSAGLGTTWETMVYAIKPYACRGGIHAAIDAAGELVAEYRFEADDVEQVVVYCTDAMAKKGGREYEPGGLNRAQMNARFCVAMRVTEGDVFIEQMTEQNTARPDLVALARRVMLVRDEERERRGVDYFNGARVKIVLKDGRHVEKTVDFPLGTERRPLTEEQMANKFRRLGGKTLQPAEVRKIEDIIWNLEREPTITPLIEALRGNETRA